MAEEKAPPGEITEKDKLMAAISYPIPLLGIIILLVEDMRSRPFQKFHAVQSLALDVAIGVIGVILSCLCSIAGVIITDIRLGLACVTFGSFPLLLWLITLYWAYLAYQGQWFDIPIVTDFIKEQGWM